MSATATFDSDTEARSPFLQVRDSVEIVEKTTALSRAQLLGNPDVLLLWQESSMPTAEDELARLPKAYAFVANNRELAPYQNWLVAGASLTTTGPVALPSATLPQEAEPAGARVADDDLIDWETRITNPPPRVVKTVVMNFVPIGKRQPRISVVALD